MNNDESQPVKKFKNTKEELDAVKAERDDALVDLALCDKNDQGRAGSQTIACNPSRYVQGRSGPPRGNAHHDSKILRSPKWVTP